MQSWDTANKPSELADYSVCTTFGVKHKHFYLLNVLRKKFGYPDLRRAVVQQSRLFGPSVILIEDKASGTQLVQELQEAGVSAVTRYKPEGDKIMRLNAQTGAMEGGFVHLPSEAHWLADAPFEPVGMDKHGMGDAAPFAHKPRAGLQRNRRCGLKDLLDQVLDGKSLDPMAVIREPLIVYETASIFRVLDQFKKAPVRLAMVIDEYGSLDGIVTQTDLLEAIAGDLPDTENEEPEIIERDDGSLLIDGMMPAHDAFERLGFPLRSADGDFHTIAGFALSRLGHLPQVGEHFDYEGWRFEIVDMDGRRIDKLRARREPATGPADSA